jgi:hypothetical protein
MDLSARPLEFAWVALFGKTKSGEKTRARLTVVTIMRRCLAGK